MPPWLKSEYGCSYSKTIFTVSVGNLVFNQPVRRVFVDLFYTAAGLLIVRMFRLAWEYNISSMSTITGERSALIAEDSNRIVDEKG